MKSSLALGATVVLRLLFEISKLYHWRQSKTILVWTVFSVIGLTILGAPSFVVILLKIITSSGVGYFYYTRVLDHRDKNTFIGLFCLVLVYIVWGIF